MDKCFIGENQKPYVMHVCRNKKCESAFLARDSYNAQNTPPQNKYCPDCTALGYKSVKDPQKVARGKALAEHRRLKREWYKNIEDL